MNLLKKDMYSNEVLFEKVKLPKPYISKKIEATALRAILGSTHQTAYRLYLIANGIKELQKFASIESDEYLLTANVVTECGFIGEAKTQIWNVMHFQPLQLKKPKFIVRCELVHLMSNKTVYRCVFEHKNPDVIYNQVQECIDNLKNILE
jgi:hypothetical protein